MLTASTREIIKGRHAQTVALGKEVTRDGGQQVTEHNEQHRIN
jgi:hypothetical protein